MRKRIGNFLISEDRNGGFMRVSAVGGNWEVRFGRDHVMYGSLLHLANDKRCEDGLDNMFAAWLSVTSTVLDRGGCIDAYECVIRQAERWRQGEEQERAITEAVDEESRRAEQERAITEAALSEELREEIMKEAADGGQDGDE